MRPRRITSTSLPRSSPSADPASTSSQSPLMYVTVAVPPCRDAVASRTGCSTRGGRMTDSGLTNRNVCVESGRGGATCGRVMVAAPVDSADGAAGAGSAGGRAATTGNFLAGEATGVNRTESPTIGPSWRLTTVQFAWWTSTDSTRSTATVRPRRTISTWLPSRSPSADPASTNSQPRPRYVTLAVRVGPTFWATTVVGNTSPRSTAHRQCARHWSVGAVRVLVAPGARTALDV